MEIQVQGNLTTVLKVVSQIVMTLVSGQPTELLYKKGVLKILAKIRGKHLRQSVFFNKVAGLRPATLLKKRLRHRFFSVNVAKFLRTPSLQNTSGRLLLYFIGGRKRYSLL